VIYQDATAPAGFSNPSLGTTEADAVHGPYAAFQGLGAGGFAGFATRQNQIYLTTGFRYVVKFALRFDVTDNVTFFTGFTAPPENLLAGIVPGATEVPPNVLRDFLGIRILGNPTGTIAFEWLAQRATPLNTLLAPTNATVRFSSAGPFGSVPFTMVIETEKYWNDVSSEYEPRARLCLYDQEMHKLSEIYIDDPTVLSTEAMEVVQSCRNNGALPGTVEHRLFYASIATRIDLPTPKT
jgi:hypothetical protein